MAEVSGARKKKRALGEGREPINKDAVKEIRVRWNKRKYASGRADKDRKSGKEMRMQLRKAE